MVTNKEIREYVLSKGYRMRNLRCRIARNGRVYAYGCPRGARKLSWFFFGERADLDRKFALMRLDGERA